MSGSHQLLAAEQGCFDHVEQISAIAIGHGLEHRAGFFINGDTAVKNGLSAQDQLLQRGIINRFSTITCAREAMPRSAQKTGFRW